MVRKLIAYVFLMGAAVTAWAAIPPPPVDQFIGLRDTSFFPAINGGVFNAAVCEGCHKGTPPPGVPIKPGYLADRHHQHVGTPIGDGPANPPYGGDTNGDGTVEPGTSGTILCLSCHKITAGFINPEFKSNCALCHSSSADVDSPTPHHQTLAAKDGNCYACHGDIVRGVAFNADGSVKGGKKPNGDPVTLPTYGMSLITPWVNNKPGSGSTPDGVQGKGNCDHCHNTPGYVPTGTVVVDLNGDGILDPNTETVLNVQAGDLLTPMNTHHQALRTGPDNKDWCLVCHNVISGGVPLADGTWMSGPTGDSGENYIRNCQRCHDIQTLHSIEYDFDQNGIVPGQETPYHGHIGNNKNCEGCHGFNMAGMEAGDTVTVPMLSGSSLATVKTGAAATKVTLSGSSLINTGASGATFTATVVVTDSAGVAHEIVPNLVTPTSIEFTLPALPAGPGIVQAKKGDASTQQTFASNPMPFVVTNGLSVTAAYCFSQYNIALVIGDGLGGYLNAADSGTHLKVSGVASPWIYVWDDNRDVIVGSVASCGSSAEISSVFDSITVPMYTF